MLKAEQLLVLLLLSVVSCGDANEITCPESTRPHKTECNKYFKCIKLPSNSLSWVVLTCQEGLIYDKNLRSCAIPPENWDCTLSSEIFDGDDTVGDDSNVYGVQNLGQSEEEEENDFVREESDEFLEVIDGDKDLASFDGKSRSDDEDTMENSGDDSVENFVTSTTPSLRMVTAQIQRLSQLIQNIPKNNNDITADDLNAYLATQKIQSNSPDYQRNNFHSNDKTTVPADGKVHPEIEAEIINRQNDMNLKFTTLAMDETTMASVKPIYYISKEPVTEIKLKSGLDGTGSHQIVVNRPEGSVLFNVPPSSENSNKQNSPYFSEDILKTILEISKQMVMQKTSNSQESSHHPVYYALPIPIIPPQSNVQNYYGQYPNQTKDTTQSSIIKTKRVPTKPQRRQTNKNRINPYKNLYKENNDDDVKQSGFGNHENTQQMNNRYTTKNQQGNYPNYNQYEYPQNYYSPYNSNYPQAYPQYYNSMPYYQYSGNDRYTPQSSLNQFSNNFNSAHYGNRPFVSDSSAPFVEHSVKKSPYQKESFSSSYENDDYDAFREESDEKFEDDLSSDDDEEKGPTDGLICTFALARQANKTDCFKYYVCNAKTKEVLSYTCPAFTAFNDQTKYCDSGIYKSCKKSQDSIAGSFKNSKVYAEAQKALQQAKRESQKVERIANMVKKQSQHIIYNRKQAAENYVDETDEYEEEPPTIYKRPALPQKSRPKVTKRISVVKTSSNKRRAKKKVKCKAPGNIPDPQDPYSYWHCFKNNSDNRMKRIHKKCTSNLRFCAQTTFCSQNC